MRIEEIRKMIETDVQIDQSALNTEASKIPQLHNKYLCMYTDEKLVLSKLENDLRVLLRDKWLYYSGKMSQEQLSERKWEQFDLNILRTDLDRFIQADSDVIQMESKCILQREKVNYLEQTVKLISNKIWNVRAVLDWIKFTQGI